jgi:hypothetical protein
MQSVKPQGRKPLLEQVTHYNIHPSEYEKNKEEIALKESHSLLEWRDKKECSSLLKEKIFSQGIFLISSLLNPFQHCLSDLISSLAIHKDGFVV